MSVRENKAAWIVEEKGRFEVGPAEIVEPEKGEVLVRTHAAGIQPADAKVAKLAVFKLPYPTIFGSPVAGFVETVGPGVTKVKVGDRVVSGTKIWTSGGISKFGAHQRFVIVDEMEVILIGETPFSSAIATASQSPVAALFASSTLNMSRPIDPLNPTPTGKTILIWGGSSATGALAISHAKNAGHTVITTSSPHNFMLLKSLGADHIFDYNTVDTTISAIRELGQIDYWLDCISLPPSLNAIFKIMEGPLGEGQKINLLLLLPPSMTGITTYPEGVNAKMLLFRNKAEENRELVEWMLGSGGYLEKGIKEGWIKGVPAECIGGLGKVEEGIERVFEGVSGRKLVVEPWIED